MRKMKKIIPLTMAFATILCLTGCGKAVPAMNEGKDENIEKEIPKSMDASDVADMLESGMTIDEVIDKVEEVKESESAATDKPAEASPTQTEKPTATPSPTQTPEPTPTSQPTQPPHVHEYKVESSTEATCATAGSVVKVCECGERQTENVPATGQHNWEPVYQTITHPSTGHVEVSEVQVQVQVGTTEAYTIYECAVCGYQDTSPLSDHRASYVGVDFVHATARTVAYDYPGGEPIYETQTQTQSAWVVDSPETTSQELIGYTCSCGATKSK